MPFQKVEFEFPDPDKPEEKGTVEVEVSSAENVLDVEPKEKPKVEPAPVPEPEAKAAEVEIEVVDDTPPKDRGRKPTEPPSEVTDSELEEYSEKVQKRIKQFSKGYHDERRRAESAQREREEAIRLAQKLIEENKRLQEAQTKSHAALLEQAKARTAAELEQAKRAYKEAYESGDADKVVAAQEALTTAKIRADKVANFKPAALQPAKTVVQTESEFTPAPAPVVDQRAVEWQKANSWFGDDDEMTSFALGLHQKLVKEGVDTRSDEYYERINRRMREVFPQQFEDDEEVPTKPATKPSKKANVVAPATRSTAPKKVVLTQTQVALAKRLGVPLELYAQKVAEQMRNQNG
jgi:hypothetical protein